MGDGRLCASGLTSGLADTINLTTWGFGGLGGADLQAVSIAQLMIKSAIGIVRNVRTIRSIRVHSRFSRLPASRPVGSLESRELFFIGFRKVVAEQMSKAR